MSNPSGTKPTSLSRIQQAQRNKKSIAEYYDLAINKRDFAAAREYIGPYYRQHSWDVIQPIPDQLPHSNTLF